MNYLLDLIFLAIIVITAFISAKYGFVRTLVELIGFVLIVMIVSTISVPISEAIYKSKIEQDVLAYKGSDNGTIQLPAEDFIQSLPDFLKKDNGIFTVDKNLITSYYNNHIKAGQDSIALKINNDIIKPATVRIISLFISGVLFTILSIFVHIVARLLNGVVRHSFARGINEKLGFLIGIFKGAIICIIVSMILLLCVANNNSDFWIFKNSAINQSFVVRFTKTILPDYGLFSYII